MSNKQSTVSGKTHLRVMASSVLTLSTLLLACGVEVPGPSENEPGDEPGVVQEPHDYGELSVVGNRLRFASREATLETLEQLDAEAALDTEGGAHTFETFEKTFGFASLRQKLATAAAQAEEHEFDADDALAELPPESEFVAWEALRAMLNVDHQIQIGDDVLTLLDDDLMVSVPASDQVALAAVVAHPETASEHGTLLYRATGEPLDAPTGEPKKAARWSTQILTLQPDGASGEDADVFSLSTAVDTNRGDVATMSALAWTWSGDPGTMRSFLKFDLTAVPSGKMIKRATLTLTGTSTGRNATEHSTLSGPDDGWLKRVLAPWNEHTITWTNQPIVAATGIALAPSTGAGQTYAVDVTSLVNEMRDDGQNYGMMLQLQNEQQYRALVFHSSDATTASLRPKLEIEYGDNTCSVAFQPTVTGLDVAFVPTPTGKGPISYSWDFGDGESSTLMAPQHTYKSAGPYNVCVTTTDADSCTTAPVCRTVSPTGFPPCCREAGQTSGYRDFHNGDRRLDGNIDMEHFFGWHVEAKGTHYWKDWNRKKTKFKWKRDKAQNIRVKVNQGRVRSWQDSQNACRGDYVDVSEQIVDRSNDSLVRVKSTIYGAFTFQKVGIEHNGLSANFHAEEHGFKTNFTLYLGNGCPVR